RGILRHVPIFQIDRDHDGEPLAVGPTERLALRDRNERIFHAGYFLRYRLERGAIIATPADRERACSPHQPQRLKNRRGSQRTLLLLQGRPSPGANNSRESFLGLAADTILHLINLRRAGRLPDRGRVVEIGAQQLSNSFLRAKAELAELYDLFGRA